MKHSFLDKYSNIMSPIHRINPVLKIIISFTFLIYIVISWQAWWNYLICFVFILVIIFVSHIPLSFVFKRALIILPFIFLITIFIPFFKEDGIKIVITTFVRSYLSIITLILLTSTTKFSHLLYGLAKIGVPKVILIILSYMYRYFFVLTDEAERMIRAVKLRTNNKFMLFKVLANITGILFIRSYERSERVYNAMVMRGFDGEIKI